MAMSMTQLLRKAAEARTAGKTQSPNQDGTSKSNAGNVTPIVVRSEEPESYGRPGKQNEQKTSAQSPRTPREDARPQKAAAPAESSPDENLVQPDGTTTRYNQTVQPDVPNGTTSRYIGLNQTVQPDGTTDQCNQEVQPLGTTTDIPNLVKEKGRTLTPQQQRVMDHLIAQGPHITDKAILSEKLGIAPFTVRNILIRLTQLGRIERKRVGQGMLVKAKESDSPQRLGTTNRLHQDVVPTSCTEQYNQGPPLKIDRKNLSISHETLETSWPTLARAGFGLEQIEQIHAALAQLGKTADRIVQGLDHAEWELAAGKMLDKAGQPVADPCAWVYRSLASQGYYRRPAGYISAEEQAERDAVEEAKALGRTRENARQERFRAWLLGLSGEEKENVMAGRIGPEEAWLKSAWTKRGEPS